ncbi:MAG: hypothetical protein A2W22_00320 [Candidatus Levybacteria bacterium RBG_16_35_11]|nr:MAG: hypothetical protein A2W22_00320 [Candidatus Levybacteria bacterium RBG_16_35_11]
MKRKVKYLVLILIMILTIPTIWGLIHSGFFPSDDGNWMVIRFSAFYEALREGQFPVRFLVRLNNTYGYPVSDFLYPLFMYLAVPIHVLGFSFVSSIKILFGISMIFSTVFSYLWLRKKFTILASLVGSLTYTYFPYHLFDLYKRGSIGEILALAIVPFVFWQIERKNLPLTSLGIGLLILSHNTVALLFLPIIFIYMLLIKIKIQKIILSFAISLGLSIFFWLPALYDSQFTIFSKTAVSEYSKYFVSFNDLSLFGFISLLTLLLAIAILFLKRSRNFTYFFLVFIVFSFLSLSLSQLVWGLIPFTGVIQFPFRLLSVVGLSCAYLIGYEVDFFKKNLKIIVSLIFLFLIFTSSKDFIYPKSFQYYPDSFYSTNLDTTTVRNEYMPRWVRSVPQSLPREKVEILEGKAEISNLTNKGNITFDIEAEQKSLISINTIYFPGWIVKVNSSKVPIDYEKSGLIQFNIEPGSHRVSVYFTETPIRLFADIISLIILVFVVYSLIFGSRVKFLRFLLI